MYETKLNALFQKHIVSDSRPRLLVFDLAPNDTVIRFNRLLSDQNCKQK